MTIIIPAWMIAALQVAGIGILIFLALIGLALIVCLKDAKFWF